MNEAIWSGKVVESAAAGTKVTWVVEFSNSPSVFKEVQFPLHPGHSALHVAYALAGAWNARYNDVSAVPVWRSVYFAGTVTSMKFILEGAKDYTPVPANQSVRVVDGLFVFWS